METRARRMRPVLACARCQKRKIKCDGQFPACGNCKSASVDCADGDSTRLGPVKDRHRAQIEKLQRRVRDLESVIKARCPDVDLSGDALDSRHGIRDTPSQNIAVVEGLATPGSKDSVLPAFTTATPPENPPAVTNNGLLAHEIGLVSSSNTQDARYIGPSSGYFLARLMVAPSRREGTLSAHVENPAIIPPPLPQGLVECLQGPSHLPPLDKAKQLCDEFFSTIHPQYPILHRPTLVAKLEQASKGETIDRASSFQVFMVLAIGAALLSQRHRVRLPSESYCLSALEALDDINVENSVSGLQCLLLLQIFTMHCPNMKVNTWYLNYQCIASVLDLGLQRDVKAGSPGISLLDQELRTRLFWVVLTLDRRIATIMGRPIGLRDEACDLRLPQEIDDQPLSSSIPPDHAVLCHTALSTHLFKLTKLSSEFKYVANSIMRDTPRYAYPAIINIHEWQQDFIHRLEDWERNIPSSEHGSPYLHRIWRLRCLELKIICLRPSPAIPTPTTNSLDACHGAARIAIDLFNQLYRLNLLVYTWDIFHSVVLTTITLLYCVKVVPGLTTIQTLGDDLNAALCVLGAIGEHWIGAKRCRDIIEELGRALITRLQEQLTGPSLLSTAVRSNTRDSNMSRIISPHDGKSADGGLYPDIPCLPVDFCNGLSMDEMFAEQFRFGESSDNTDTIMHSLFDGFIPTRMY